MKRVYYIREKNGKWNFSLVKGKHKVLGSHRQDYSRKCDCVATARNNIKPPYQEMTATRAEFKKIYG